MFKWIWTILSLGAPELGESESWIKLVTSNYCTCDLWTTLLLGGKTFPIIEAFFFFGFEFRPHSIIPVTWNQYNIYSHTSSTYRSVEGHHWLINWVTKTHPPSTPVENCNPCWRRVHCNLGDGGSEKVSRFKISRGWHLCLRFSHPTNHIAESYFTRNFKSSCPKFYHAQQLATTL